MKPLLEAVLVLTISAALSVVNWYAQPGVFRSMSAEHDLSLEQALAMDEAIWLDARTRAEFEAGSYAGALLLNEDD